MKRVYAYVGGRKAFSSYLAAFLLTALVFPLGGSYHDYGTFVLIALGLGKALIAGEDAVAKWRRHPPEGDEP